MSNRPKRFNLRHNGSGHLFQGRYKNMLVQNDAYLLQLFYYIHRNPLKPEWLDAQRTISGAVTKLTPMA